jgi:hypothetical protein
VRRAALIALAVALLASATTPADAAKHRRRGHVLHGERVGVVKEPAVKPPTARPPRPQVPTPTPTPTPAPTPKPLGRIQVIAREFSLTLSRRTVAAGPVAIELDNYGQDPHDLRVERGDDALTGFSFTLAKPHAVSSRKLELSPGEWKLYCTLPGHEALGMSARVTVSG